MSAWRILFLLVAFLLLLPARVTVPLLTLVGLLTWGVLSSVAALALWWRCRERDKARGGEACAEPSRPSPPQSPSQ